MGFLINFFFLYFELGLKSVPGNLLSTAEAAKCKLKLEKCFLCQKLKETWGDNKLANSENGSRMFEGFKRWLVEWNRGKSKVIISWFLHLLLQMSFLNITYFHMISASTWRYYSDNQIIKFLVNRVYEMQIL